MNSLIPLFLLFAVSGVSSITSCSSSAPSTYSGVTKVYAWGNNYHGQLGFRTNGTTQPALTNVGSSTTPRVTKCSGGFMTHTAILAGAGTTSSPHLGYFAGRSNEGQTGHGAALLGSISPFSRPSSVIPYKATDTSVPISLTDNVIDMCCGWSHCCIIVAASGATSGSVLCAGSHAKGQGGWGKWASGSFSTFAPITTMERDGSNLRQDTTFMNTVTFTKLACGGDHTLAVTAAGALYGWGSNAQGQLAAGATTTVTLARQLVLTGMAAGDTVNHVATGHAFSIVVTKGTSSSVASVFVFGSNAEKQLGQSSLGSTNTAATKATGTLADIAPRITSISAGGTFAAAVVEVTSGDSTSRRLYTWGEGTAGATGQPVPSGYESSRWYVDTPTAVADLTSVAVAKVSTGFSHTVVLSSCNQLLAAGQDSFGQLGVGGTSQNALFRRRSFVEIPRIAKWGVRDH